MKRYPARTSIYRLASLWVTLMISSLCLGTEGDLPHKNKTDKFLGIETCGSSTCHGSPEPWRNATVLMKERLIWEHSDPHSDSFESLKSPRAKAITKNLNLKNATEAPQCLTCHTTYIPEEQRGEKFSLTSGVTCESCHGPGGAFLSTHIQPDSNHIKNVEAGLYPTDSPIHRAKLCLSCHQANAVNKFSHRYYGAGHPRLRFELETYTAIQPYHFNRDADYKRRKNPASQVYAWAKGQMISSLNLSESLLTNVKSGDLLPELAHFECSDCHQSIADLSKIRRPNKYFGTPSINISNLIMVHAIASSTDPSLAKKIKWNISTLLRETHSRSSIVSALSNLTKQIRILDTSLEKLETRRVPGLTLAKNVISSIKQFSPTSYYTAEMTAMSLSNLVVIDFEDKRIDSEKRAELEQKLDWLFENLGNESNFNHRNYLRAVNAFATGIENAL